MLSGVDGDIFGAVTKLGRNAAEGLVLAVQGGLWDPFLAARCIEVLVTKADGIKSLPAVVDLLHSLQASPLLASTMVEDSLDRIDGAVRAARGTVLDLMLRSVVHRKLLQGDYDPRSVLQQFCAELLDRAIVSGRDGFLELEGGGRARRVEAMAVLAPVAAQAAACLDARPDAKRLGLTRGSRLEADSDLLGGGP